MREFGLKGEEESISGWGSGREGESDKLLPVSGLEGVTEGEKELVTTVYTGREPEGVCTGGCEGVGVIGGKENAVEVTMGEVDTSPAGRGG